MSQHPDDAGFFHFREGTGFGVPDDVHDFLADTESARWTGKAERFHASRSTAWAGLVRDLGLPDTGLDVLDRAGFDLEVGAMTFPLTDGAGTVVGIATRDPNTGEKKVLKGSKLGLHVPPGLAARVTGTGAVFVLEGPTCTAAATCAGLAAVGRASNRIAGYAVPWLAELLRGLPHEGRVVVVGERDAKPDGSWPGRDGASDTAAKLAVALGRAVEWALPPEGVGVKDARDWLTHPDREGVPWPDRGPAFAELVLAVTTSVEPGTAAAEATAERWNNPRTTAAAVLADHRLLRVKDRNYVFASPRYVPVEEEVVRAWVLDLLEAAARVQYRREVAASRAASRPPRRAPVVPNVTRNTTRDVEAVLHARGQCQSLVERDRVKFGCRVSTGEPVKLLPVANGLLDPHARKLHPADPDVFATMLVPVTFDPVATPSARFLNMVHGVANGRADRVAAMQEMFGACLDPWGTHKQFWVLTGGGDNGKTAVLVVLRALLGAANCSAVPLDALSERFGTFELLHKLANVVGDQGRFESRDESRLKAITGGDAVRFEAKGKMSFSAPCTARQVFACNELPRFGDKSGAVWERLQLIECDAVFRGSRADPTLVDAATWAADLPGVLNWALEGLARLMASGPTSPAGAADAKAVHRAAGDHVRAFLTGSYRAESGGAVPVDELFAAYRRWCDANGVPAHQRVVKGALGQRVRDVFPIAVAKVTKDLARNSVRAWKGVAPADDPGDEAPGAEAGS